MIFNSRNTKAKCSVHVIDTGEEIECVLQCDSDTAEVTQAVLPLRVNHAGEVDTRVRKFSGLWPIYEPRQLKPTLFHCHGEVLT